jgi:hypothetical protein
LALSRALKFLTSEVSVLETASLGKDRFYWFISVSPDICPVIGSVILWAQGDPLSELETTRFQMANDLLRTTGRDDAYWLVHFCSNRLPAWGVVSRSLADATQLR